MSSSKSFSCRPKTSTCKAGCGRCKTCRRPTETPGTKYCPTCRKRQSRERDPVKYSYDNIRHRAKQRGKPFTITLSYFRRFCYKNDYIQNKGKTVASYTVDCIKNELGYVKGNLQILALAANSRKGVRRLEYDWRTKTAFVYRVNGTPLPLNDDYAF